MPIVPPLRRFVDDELARAPALIERALVDTIELLREFKGQNATPTERAMQTGLAEDLRRHAVAYRTGFVDSLQARVMAELERQDGGSGMAPPSGLGGLALMDESRVEIDIEISRATQMIDAAAEWELRELQAFTSTLIGQAHVSPESNPLRPMLYATALWDAVCVVQAVQVRRAALLRAAATASAPLLKKAWAAASTRLESQGVTPGVFRTVVLDAGNLPSRHAAPALPGSAAPASMTALLSAMPGGSDMRISPGGPSGTRPAASGRSDEELATVPSPAFDHALARVDEILRELPDKAVSRSDAKALAQRLEPHRAALAASVRTPRGRQLVALLSRVFDAMLADPQLHPSFVALVARLQVSVLRVALRNPAMFESTSTPVWSLLDRIGQASASFPQASDPRGGALRKLCQRLVEELTRTTTLDPDIHRKALVKLDEFLAAQMDAQLRAAERSLQALREAETQELQERSMTQRLVEQMEPLRPSAAVRRFVSGSWSRVLVASISRFGQDAQASKDYIKLVDDLLWSVQLPDHPASRRRLVALLPDMLHHLRAGMALIALPQAEQQAIQDELTRIHTAALSQGEPAVPAESTPGQILQEMRDEVIAPATAPGELDDGLIDLASLQTVPAELMPLESATLGGDAAAKQIASLQPASRQRMFVNGRWACVQLLWRSDRGLVFLFAGEVAGRTHSITRSALEKLVGAGLLRPLEAVPLAQRALDSVARQVSTSNGLPG